MTKQKKISQKNIIYQPKKNRNIPILSPFGIKNGISSGPHWKYFDFHFGHCGLTTALPLPQRFLRVGAQVTSFLTIRFYVLILRFQSQAFSLFTILRFFYVFVK